MKNLLLIACLLMGTTLLAQEVASSEKEGVFEFQSEIIDYGYVKKNSEGTRQFVFKNVGDAAIVISHVKTSCGCTVVTKPEKPILPGETGQLTVNYSTNKTGTFSKKVSVSSNASEKTIILKIKGTVTTDSNQEVTLKN